MTDDNIKKGDEISANGEQVVSIKEIKMDIPLVNEVHHESSGVQHKIVKQIKKKLPITSWLPNYNLDFAVSDVIAGVTVGLTVIPQGIAYALVANLPPQFGLYSAFMGCFMYCIFGSVKDITIGPTAIMAIMTGDVFKEGEANIYGSYYAVLLAFTSGIIILIFGMLQLGFLIDFISMPVIAGFTSAAAITIASGQIKGLLGIYTLPENKNMTETHAGVVDDYIHIFANISTVRWQDAVLGLTCAVVLLAMRFLGRAKKFKPDSSQSRGQFILNKTIWFVCTSRNAIIVIVCLVMAALLDPNVEECRKTDREYGNYSCTFMVTGQIDAGVPPFEVPPFSIPENATDEGPEHEINFSGMLSELGSAIIIIPIIAILESIAIAKAFSGGKPVDASQEMIALGICNIMGSFVSSMPTTGSFSRTAVNSSSGVKTPLGGLYTGALVLLCLAFLMNYCAFIPKATLSAVIMTAVIFSVEYEVVLPIWSSKRLDLIPGFICFFVGLFSELDYGIFAGMGVHLAMVLYQIARPKVEVEVKVLDRTGTDYIFISPDQGIIFPSATHIRALISKVGIKQGYSRMSIVIDCTHINKTDFTAAKAFKAMIADFDGRQQKVFWLNPNDSIKNVLSPIAGESFRVISSVEELSELGSDETTPTYQNYGAEVQS